MRKITAVFALFMGAITCYGQDENVYKPEAQKWTAEINFNPFTSSPVSIAYLRTRKFITEKQALRLGVGIGYKEQKPAEGVKQSSFEINIRPGYEKHFAGTDRLSPYIGVDADIAFKSSTYSNDGTSGGGGPYYKSVSGAWDASGTEQGYTRFGANFLVGADFYFAKKMYLGLEFGLGFQLVNYADVKLTQPGGFEVTQKGTSAFQLGPNYNSALRLGFVF